MFTISKYISHVVLGIFSYEDDHAKILFVQKDSFLLLLNTLNLGMEITNNSVILYKTTTGDLERYNFKGKYILVGFSTKEWFHENIVAEMYSAPDERPVSFTIHDKSYDEIPDMKCDTDIAYRAFPTNTDTNELAELLSTLV